MASDNCSRTLNGPYCFGLSFADGYRVLIFVPSTQTWSPLLYGLNLLFPWFLSAMVFCARPISASALFLACSISSSRFVTVGTLLIPSQSVLGVNPMIRSNGVFFVVSCGHLLCANSVNGNHWCQLFWSLQKHHRYCSSHWFVRSDCPSVLGWYAVEIFWCILSAWHNPLAYLDVNLVSRSEMIFFGTPNHG